MLNVGTGRYEGENVENRPVKFPRFEIIRNNGNHEKSLNERIISF